MNEKLINYIESSFIKNLVEIPDVTDISFNGKTLFYLHNTEGRKKADIKVDATKANDFIRQIANFSEKQFSYSMPILDVSVGRYRINAVHQSIVRVFNDKSCSFSIRICSNDLKIIDDYKFINEDCRKYLKDALENEESIVIAGPTGSGKTELQKFLLTNLRDNSRVIVIDNVEELEAVRINENIDITSWQISQSNQNSSIQELVKNALRSNPDWLVVAESRGKEMNEVLNSVMTGHPIITTLHARRIEDVPLRICRMVEMSNVNQKHDDILDDVQSNLRIYVFLNRKYKNDGGVERYIESIGEIQDDHTMKIIYRRKK